MNKNLIKPNRYDYLLYVPWKPCLILMLLGFLGIVLHTLLSINIIELIITTLINKLAFQQLQYFSILLTNFCWKLSFILIVTETLLATAYYYQGIRVIKSMKLTYYLQNTLTHTLDIIPTDNIDRRVTASEVDAKRANKAIKKSIVIVFQNSALIFIKLPTEIGIRHSIARYSDEAATDIAEILNMRKSGRQVYQDHHTFNKYYYYELHN